MRRRTRPTRISQSSGCSSPTRKRNLHDVERTTQLGAEFHLAVAEASHNRVLVVQLISLQHVSWPRRNPTLTPKVARRILDVHKELLALIEIRDAAGARKLMDDHVKMIRARTGDGASPQDREIDALDTTAAEPDDDENR